MRHEHHFKEQNGVTVMEDIFEYEVRLGWLGKVFDRIYLKQYMTRLLEIRNRAIKKIAEY